MDSKKESRPFCAAGRIGDMTRTRKVFLLLLAALFVLAGCGKGSEEISAIQQAGKLRVLTSAEFPPYEYHDVDGKAVGADMDLAARIASRLGVELEVVECNYTELVPALLDGEGDLILSALPNAAAKGVAYSEPYLSTEQYIVTAAKSEIAAEEDLEGKILGVQLGTQGDYYATDMASAKNIERFSNMREALQVLQDGKLDALVTDKATAAAMLAAQGDALKKIYIGENAADYCVGMRAGSDLQPEVEALLAEMKAAGELDALVLAHTFPATQEGA